MDAQTAIQRGKEVLAAFHNASLKYPQYTATLADLIANLGTEKQQPIHLQNLGEECETYGLRYGDIEDAMEALAAKYQGKIPPFGSSTAYFQALGGKIGEVSFAGAAYFVAKETAVTVATGLKEVGDATLETLKTFRVIGPVVIVAAVLFVVYARTKQAAGK